MRVALTGSTGFVGRRILERLREMDCSVVPLTRDGAGGSACWDLEAEINDPRVLEGVDALIHTAGYLPRDYRDPSEAARCFQVNALGSLALLEASAAAGVGHVVVFSTGNLYQNGETAAREDDAIFPSTHASFYLVSKLAEEAFAHFVRERRGLSISILRPSSIYGPGMSGGGVVARFAKQLRAGDRVQVQGGGRHTVDLVYVDDVVSAAIAAAQMQVNEVFNIGSGRSTSVLELARTYCRILELDERSLVGVEPALGGESTGFAPLDVSLARERLCYRPTPLDEGIRRFLECLS